MGSAPRLNGLQDSLNQLFEDASQRRARGGTATQDPIGPADWLPAAECLREPRTM